jgi:hypothetical protein
LVACQRIPCPSYLHIIFEEAINRAPFIVAERLGNELKPSIEDTCFLHIPLSLNPKNPNCQQLQQAIFKIMIHHNECRTNPLPKINDHIGWPVNYIKPQCHSLRNKQIYKQTLETILLEDPTTIETEADSAAT